ncbi:MAG: hypothetical protein NTY45_11675 [Elusimicrobia bacterium]|nr:hypothetical protein [Elusimicrobiota bacterium]
MFNFIQARNVVLTAAAVGLFVCAPSRALPTAPERLAVYTTAISSGDPAAASAFLSDGEALTLAEAGPGNGAALKAKAEALKDLKALLAMPWDKTKVNNLSQALSIRIDADKPLSKMGVGPAPEKLLAWLGKYQPAYPAAKTDAVKAAIRQWEVVFGTMTDTRGMSWGQASMLKGSGVKLTRANWEGWTIRERNAAIATIAKKDPSFMIYDDAAVASSKGELDLLVAISRAQTSGALSAPQLAQLNGKSFADQVYLLGSFFDGSNIAVDEDIKAKINAARSALPNEVLSTERRKLLGDMLGGAVTKELAGTEAGDRALAFFGGQVKIAIKPCDGAYSRYDAATGTIILDSETIQQYMRMKGYNANTVLREKELTELAKYMSPAVVYEAAHGMQAAWARQQGVYKPHVQEDEIEAMSLEGLYTTEKMGKDPEYARILTSGRDFSSYASKKLEIGTEYSGSGSKKFATTVRQRYFSGLPSLDAAASHVLTAVSGELSRRAAMSPSAKASIDSTGIPLNEALAMAPDELAGSVGEIQTAVLAKIQGDLSRLGVYRSRYSASDREDRKALKDMETDAAPRNGAPPAL